MNQHSLKTLAAATALAALAACGSTGPSPNYGSTTPVTSTASTASGYGVVQAIDIVPRESSGIGLGTVAGAVVGGALGSQVGGGSGRTAAAVAGTIGGGLAGRAIENRNTAGNVYRISILMDNGAVQSMVQETPPGLQVGERVRLSNGVVVERFR